MIGKDNYSYHLSTRRSEDARGKHKSGSSSTNTSSDGDSSEHLIVGLRPLQPSSSIYGVHQQTTTRTANRYKLKVELCKNYSLHKCCPYELNCRFAHGVEELLEATQNYATFRTKKCKSYFTEGYCKYGHRCNFKHETKERQPWRLDRSLLLEHYPELLLLIPCARLSQLASSE